MEYVLLVDTKNTPTTLKFDSSVLQIVTVNISSSIPCRQNAPVGGRRIETANVRKFYGISAVLGHIMHHYLLSVTETGNPHGGRSGKRAVEHHYRGLQQPQQSLHIEISIMRQYQDIDGKGLWREVTVERCIRQAQDDTSFMGQQTVVGERGKIPFPIRKKSDEGMVGLVKDHIGGRLGGYLTVQL